MTSLLAGSLLASLTPAVATSVEESAANSAPAIIAVDDIKQQRLDALPAFIDQMVEDQIKTSEVAGAVVTVVYDGKIYASKGYGFKNIEAKTPVDPDATLFHPGSVSKLFTWVALMQQIEAGTVDLDTDVNHYIDFEIPRNGFDPITVRDLFSHSPGMSDISGFIVDDPDKLMPYAEWIQAKVPRRVWAPGIETAYSNFGAALAGYIVERVSGEPFDEYTKNHIFAPLGMTSTTFSEPLAGVLAENMATGYKVENGEFIAKGPEYLSLVMPAGSAVSTGSDMGRFMLAMLNGGALDGKRILKQKSVRLLQSNSFANAPRLAGMAHGFLVERDATPRLVGHAGNTVDFHSDLVIAPELGFGYYISMSGGEGSSDARTVLTKAITGYMFPQAPTSRWSGAAETAPMGRYRSNRRDYARAPNKDYDTLVSAKGPNSLEINVRGEKSAWERIGPHLYEKVTDVPEGGPYDRVEFYQTERGPRLSFSFEPYTAYHFIEAE
ncbi:serine hydrolase domain-containing protein [Parasphingorhabdus sp.]|uniref:serine hydrolase domain-containing protein n=1 Tax=Parasphingorhabdus sp. TaxID=2709688 RepID=UPI002F91F617